MLYTQNTGKYWIIKQENNYPKIQDNKEVKSLEWFQDFWATCSTSTILRGNFLHLTTPSIAHRLKTDNFSLSRRCWRQTLYSTGRLIRLGIFFFFFAITLWYVTGLWRQCYIIPHGFTASERDSWELLCIFTALPSNLFSLQPASLFLSEWGVS